MSSRKLDVAAATDKLAGYLKLLRRYARPAFLLFVAALYSFVLLRIDSLSNQQPSAVAVNSQVQAAAVPHIDQTVVNQLQSLQDNSVSVQALFNQTRSNPFQ